MKTIPSIMKYMTTTPHTIGGDQTISVAHDLMKTHQIRHMPVLTGGQITGMVSDRDLKLAMSLIGVDIASTKVEEVATKDVFLVKPDSKLDGVVRTMAEKKIGSVLIVDNHRLVGIFTTIDALRALDELLQSRLAN